MNKPDDEFNTSAAGSLLALGLSAVNSFVGAKTKKDMLAVGQTLDSALGRLSVVEAATTALAAPPAATVPTRVPAGTKFAVGGDSREFQATVGDESLNLWTYNVSRLLRGRLNIVQHVAVGGALMSDFLSTQAPAVSQAIGGVITDFGINDIIQSRKSLAELKVAHTAIMAWARSRDLWWIDTTTTTAAALTASERNVLRAFNLWRSKRGVDYAKFRCVDLARYSSKPDLSNITDGWHSDGLHLITEGAWQVARRVAPDFAEIFDPYETEFSVVVNSNPYFSGAWVGSPFGLTPEGFGLDTGERVHG